MVQVPVIQMLTTVEDDDWGFLMRDYVHLEGPINIHYKTSFSWLVEQTYFDYWHKVSRAAEHWFIFCPWFYI